MGGYAWVTLATNNSYSLGALVLAHSLKKSNTVHKMVVLITPAVSEPMREQLQTVFDLVKVVDVLDSKDEAHLALMKRPDLGITFTKIHCWRLVEFEKCVFLDADTLVVRNCDELFEREEFSAAPDVSWPDCFNSGVFVYRPSIDTFNKLLQFAVQNRSFDGGDQGLLNQFFSGWATEDIKKHLPFVYNLTSIAAYSYIPAFKHYGSETRIVHFIGEGKPWLQQLDVATRTVIPSTGSEHLAPLLQQWWDVFCEKVHPNLDKSLETNNDGMLQPPVDACSNSVAIALTDEPQTARLTEPCTPYREKDDFRQYNLPYQPFDVKGSSGELLNVEFMLVSASEKEDVPLEEDKKEESFESNLEGDEGEKKEQVEGGGNETEEEPVHEELNNTEEGKKVEDADQNQQEEPPPVKEEKEFFPDENYINNYMEQNVMMYQPFESHHETVNCEREPEQDVPSLQRFLAIPEDDQRQSGNIMPNKEEEYNPPKSLPPEENPPPRESTPPKEQPVMEKRELTKSKSMSYIPSDFKATEVSLPRSIWKSQPNLNVDPNKRYSMPKLKPILPKQNSFSKSVPSAMPKVTLYTEFLMSSEYKDPIDLPKDKTGFVESHIHKEAKLRRCKSDADIRSKFGPLPYSFFPEVQMPVIPKKFPPRHLDNEIYDLSKCKRQMGNKPKPKNAEERRENVQMLPALRPILPAKDKKSTLIKKRKSKELSPGVGGREKILKREPKIVRERRRESKITPRNVSTSANAETLDQILQKLREFSKDYQHFFGVTWGGKKKIVKCKNAEVQAGENEGGECKASEAFETVSLSVSTRSKETQTGKDGAEFRQFRNYVKDKRETSQKGLLSIQDILSQFEQLSTETDGSSKLNDRVVRAEMTAGQREVDAASAQEYSKCQTTANDGDSMVKDSAKEEIESINIPDIEHNNSSQSRSPAEVESEKTFPESHSRFEVSQTCLPNDSEIGETSKELDSAVTKSEEERPNSSDIIKTPENGEKSNNSLDSGQLPELQSSSQNDEKPNPEASRACLASETPKTIIELDSEAEKSEEVRPNTTDISDAFQTPEIGNQSKDNLDPCESTSPELQKSNENGEETSEEHSRKKDCDYPPLLEQKGRKQSSSTAKTPTESQPIKNGVSSEDAVVESAPVISSHVITQPEQKDPSEGELERPQQGKTKIQTNWPERPKNPNEILCVPDFETPRSSRVTLPTPKTAADQPETIMAAEKRKSTIPERNGQANGLDSPEGTVRIVGKKKSGRKSTPPSSGFQDLNGGSGIAGAIAQLSLDAGAQTAGSAAASAAQQEYLRRQNWETGNMDYMGRDSFDNIWSKICQTLEAKETEEEAGGSPKQTTAEEKKPEAIPPTEDPVTLATILQKCPEFIETLPGDPTAGPVEDDEIIFSKPENRQSCLTNITEDEEGRTETSEAAGKVKLSDILQPESGKCENVLDKKVEGTAEVKEGPKGEKVQPPVMPTTQITPPTPTPTEQIQPPVMPSAEKTPASPKAEQAPPAVTPMGEKVQSPVTPPAKEIQPSATAEGSKAQPPATPTPEQAQPPTAPTSVQVPQPPTPVGDKVQPATPTGEKSPATPTAEKTPLPPTSAPPFQPPVAPASQPLGTPTTEKPPAPTAPAAEQAAPPVTLASQALGTPTTEKPLPTPTAEKTAPPVTPQSQPLGTPTTEKPPPPATPTAEQAAPPVTPTGEKIQPPVTSEASKAQPPATPVTEQVQPPTVPTSVQVPLPSTPTADKVEVPKAPAGEKAQPEVLPSGGKPTEVPQSEKPECKTVQIPPSSPTTQLPTAEGQPTAEKKAAECTTVAIPSPPIIFPGAPFEDKGKPAAKGKKREDKPEVKSEPIPLPPPESPTLAPTEEPTAKVSDSQKEEGKQKKGVFSKILEMVGVAPKEKNGSEAPKSVFYDVQGGAEEAKEVEQASEVKEKPEEEVKTSEPEEKTTEPQKTEELPAPKAEEAVKKEEKAEQQEKKVEETKRGQGPKQKPARSPQEGKKGGKESSSRKSASPKLKMPQSPPAAAMTTPTPPPQTDIPSAEGSGLLKVDETILETPPVADVPKESVAEAVKGKVDDIIGKAKSEVESLLQDRRSSEKEVGESTDLINTMKLMMGAEEPEKAEEVEELKVTSEEERKRHKGEAVSSKLSDQILKAIPPPRRKAISEASASTSSIPKGTPAPEQQKTAPGESKGKSSKPSSIPVPPPRSRGKPSPPKGKGKK